MTGFPHMFGEHVLTTLVVFLNISMFFFFSNFMLYLRQEYCAMSTCWCYDPLNLLPWGPTPSSRALGWAIGFCSQRSESWVWWCTVLIILGTGEVQLRWTLAVFWSIGISILLGGLSQVHNINPWLWLWYQRTGTLLGKVFKEHDCPFYEKGRSIA